MTVQATVGGGVLASVLGVGAARELASGATSRGAVLGAGAARELASGASGRGVVHAAGRDLAVQATETLPRTGLSQTLALLSLAFVLLVMGMLLNGLARRHRPLGGGWAWPAGNDVPLTA